MRKSKYTEEEKAAYKERENKNLEDFKKRLEEERVEVNKEIHDDLAIRRFLGAYRQDLDKAYEAFLSTLKWRAEIGADDLVETAPTKIKNFAPLQKYWPARYHSFDKDGAPVYYERIGAVDVRGIVNTVPGEDLIAYHIYLQEVGRRMKAEQTAKLDKSCYAHIIVEDLKGLGWGHIYTPAMDLFKRVIAIDQANYPNTLKKYYVINSPAFLSMVFKMVSPWLDPATLAKVSIMGSDYKEALLADIPEENLPVAFGGKCECEGGCVPGGGPYEDAKEDGTTHNPVEVTVGRKDTYQTKVVVAQEGSLLTWEFSTVGYDIGFGLSYETADGQLEVIKETERKNSHEEPVEGEHTTTKAGTYVFTWDNTYSMWTKKPLKYLVSIFPPGEMGEGEKKE